MTQLPPSLWHITDHHNLTKSLFSLTVAHHRTTTKSRPRRSALPSLQSNQQPGGRPAPAPKPEEAKKEETPEDKFKAFQGTAYKLK